MRLSSLVLSARVVVLALMVAAAASTASAQRADTARGRGVAGEFDHYVLSLSWSPTHCVELDPRERDPQCEPRPPRPYAFVLHGLWPQYEQRGWPEFCETRSRPFVPESLIGRMLDIMPSRKLVIHQYRKHGTCSGLDPEAYFSLSRRIFETIRIPEKFVEPAAPFTIGRDAVIDAFLAANPALERDMVTVTCGGSGPRLQEVRICFARDGKPRGCNAEADQRRLCRADRLFVPPVRGGGDAAGRAPQSPQPLPPGMMPGGPSPGRRI